MVADGVEIPAHKMVLASCSPYFYAMFTSFTESKAEKITIQGVDGQALQILVDYVYSSEIQVTEDNVQVIICLVVSSKLKKLWNTFVLKKSNFYKYLLSIEMCIEIPFKNSYYLE